MCVPTSARWGMRAGVWLLAITAVAQWPAAAQQAPNAARIEHADKEPQNWMTYYGNYQGWSYSALDQISKINVKQLVPAWAFAAGMPPADSNLRPGLIAAPLEADGVLYLVGMQNNVYAVDAETGKLMWKYVYPWPAKFNGPGPRGARGLAMGDGRIYMGTQDNHLVALDQATGKPAWNISVEDNALCRCGMTSPPLFVRGKVVTGVAGTGRWRAYVRAFDAATGKLDWNFDVVPSPDQPGGDSWPADAYKTGGGATWLTGTYDPETNVIFWGTGDPSPAAPEARAGANLYTDSLIALDGDSGKLKWYNQEIPHDQYVFDSSMEPVLIDASVNGAKRKLVVHPTKGGYSYVYDRETGKMVHAFPFTAINWSKGLDADGKPMDRVEWRQQKDFVICPGIDRGRGSNHSAYSPKTGWWYTEDMASCARVNDGQSKPITNPNEGPSIAAYDPVSGKKQWSVSTKYYNYSSLLATAGDLIFGGDLEGNAFALDARSGQTVWQFNTGSLIASPPVSYSVKGRQYIAISTGGGSADERNVGLYFPGVDEHIPPVSSTLFVFALPAGK